MIWLFSNINIGIHVLCWLLCRDNVYGVLDWQRVGARLMIQHYLDADIILHVCIIYSFLAILCYSLLFAVIVV